MSLKSKSGECEGWANQVEWNFRNHICGRLCCLDVSLRL